MGSGGRGYNKGPASSSPPCRYGPGMNLRRVVPGFLERVLSEERAELVNDFAVAVDTVIVVVNVEEVIRGDG